ncbi:hypothetical protein ACJX0J_019690, partial [Zea mays]
VPSIVLSHIESLIPQELKSILASKEKLTFSQIILDVQLRQDWWLISCNHKIPNFDKVSDIEQDYNSKGLATTVRGFVWMKALLSDLYHNGFVIGNHGGYLLHMGYTVAFHGPNLSG